MARTMHMRGNYLGGIGNAGVRRAMAALAWPARTAYEQTTAAGSVTGLNGPNRVRNSATLVAEPNLAVNVIGNVTWRVYGKLFLSLTAGQGIKLDFNVGTAAIVSGTMGGRATLWTTGSNTNATAIGATNAIPFNVALTALSTSVDGGTANTWTSMDFDFTALFSQSGSVQLEFAQSSAGASNTDILPGSFIVAEPLDYFDQSA